LTKGAGELVGAGGAAGLAIDSGEAVDDIADLHPCAEAAEALGVAVATLRIFDAADDLALGFDIYLFGADCLASFEGSLADRALANIAN